MKTSNYNYFIPRDKITVCYNSFKDSLLVLKNEVYNDYIEKNIAAFKIEHPKSYELFVEHGFIIPEERDELELIRMEHKLAISDRKDLQIMLYPTQDCNLKCWYCYENHVKGSRMTKEVKQNIILFVQNELARNSFENLNLTFFGGEPLMFFEEIAYYLSFSIKKLCEEKGKIFSTFFISNGSLINENIIDKLQSINPYFQITLDGNKDKHDQVRIGKMNSFPTYDKIVKAIHLLSKKISPIDRNNKRIITLRINYDNDTLKNIDSLLEDIKNIDRNSIFVHLERVWQTRNQINEEQVRLLVETVRKFVKNGFLVGVGLFGSKRYTCPAEKLNYAIINYNGLVYRCNGRNLIEETNEGRLTNDGEIEWNNDIVSKRLGRTTFENPMCLACKMLPQCMGPCSQKNMECDWMNLSKVCSLPLLDMSLEQYILLKCEMDVLLTNK